MYTLISEKIFDNWKPFKNNEKYFSFHLKGSFRSHEVLIFVFTFGHVEKRLH